MIYHTAKRDDWNSPVNNLDGLDAEVRITAKNLREHADTFDVIAVTGMSGVVPGVPVSMRIKKPLAILRKPNDGSHQHGGQRYSGDGSRWINGDVIRGKRVLWLDDFISSGKTRQRIEAAVAELGGKVTAEYITRYHSFREVNA